MLAKSALFSILIIASFLHCCHSLAPQREAPSNGLGSGFFGAVLGSAGSALDGLLNLLRTGNENRNVTSTHNVTWGNNSGGSGGTHSNGGCPGDFLSNLLFGFNGKDCGVAGLLVGGGGLTGPVKQYIREAHNLANIIEDQGGLVGILG